MFTIWLQRKSKNCLCEDIMRKHMKAIAAAAEGNQALGLKAAVSKLGRPETIWENGQEMKRYIAKIRIWAGKAGAEEQFPQVQKLIEKCANSKDWEIVSVKKGVMERTPQEVVAQGPLAACMGPRPPFKPPFLTPELLAAKFGEIYERDAHLRVLNDAIQTHALTLGEIRAHTLLYGLPGGCKSTLLERLEELLIENQPVERMTHIDTSTATKAGLEKWILERSEGNILPEVLVLEEIEKCDKDNLLCLGSVMTSGYIMRTNAHVSRAVASAKFLLLATCNDELALKEFRRGFIWDRFTNPLHCPLPDETTMHRILLDRIARIPGGNPLWADRAMELAHRLRIKYPRAIIGFLAGRDRLLTEEYQRDRIAIVEREQAEKQNPNRPG